MGVKEFGTGWQEGQEQPLEERAIREIFRHQEGANRRIFHDRSVIEEWEGVCCAQRAWKKSRRGGLACCAGSVKNLQRNLKGSDPHALCINNVID